MSEAFDTQITDSTYAESENQSMGWGRKTASSLLLVGGLAAFGFQQSPANEAVRTAITLDVFERADNKVSAAMASGAATMVIEGGTSTLMALSLTREASAANKFIDRYKKKKSVKQATSELDGTEARALSSSKRIARGAGNTALALMIGPGVLVVKKHITGENSTTRQAMRTGLGYSALGAAVSAGVFGYGVTTGSEGVKGFASGTPFESVAQYATDAKTWVTGLGVASVVYGISVFKRSRNKEEELNSTSRGNK